MSSIWNYQNFTGGLPQKFRRPLHALKQTEPRDNMASRMRCYANTRPSNSLRVDGRWESGLAAARSRSNCDYAPAMTRGLPLLRGSRKYAERPTDRSRLFAWAHLWRANIRLSGSQEPSAGDFPQGLFWMSGTSRRRGQNDHEVMEPESHREHHIITLTMIIYLQSLKIL